MTSLSISLSRCIETAGSSIALQRALRSNYDKWSRFRSSNSVDSPSGLHNKEGAPMNKLFRRFAKPTWHVFFFCLFLVLLSWPFMTVPDRESPAHTMAVYLFVVWLIMIGVLFFFGRTNREDMACNHDQSQELGGR